MSGRRRWHVDWENGVGDDPDNEVYREWWTVADGSVVFSTEERHHALWLRDILNDLDAEVDV